MGKLKHKINKVPQTIKISGAYAVCSIIQRSISFITMPLFTRLLTTEQYGQVTIYQSWQGILSIFLTLNLAYGSFSTAMVKFEDDRDGYISSVQGICIILSLLFLAIYLPFDNLWNILFELPTEIMCVMVIEALCVNALLFWSGKKRFEFKYKSVVAVTLISSFISPVIQYVLVVNSEEKGFARIIGAATVSVVVGLFFLIWNFSKGKKLINKKYWKFALGFNIPLLAYYLSQIVFNQSDRIMISHIVGTDKAAVYGVAYSLAMMLTFVLNAINNSYVPWLYEKIKAGKMKENRSVSLGISIMMACMLFVIIWFAPEIIIVMAGEQYMEAIYVVPPVAITLLLLFYAQLFINVEFYYEEKKKLIIASIGAAIINLVLNWFFIERYGFIAAAYTTLFSYIIFVVSNYFAMKSVLKKHRLIEEGLNYIGLIATLLSLCLVAVVGVLLYPYLWLRIIGIVTLIIILFIFRKRLIAVYKEIRS